MKPRLFRQRAGSTFWNYGFWHRSGGDEMADPTWRCIELHRDLRQCRLAGWHFGFQLQPFRWAGSQAPPLIASSISSVTESECFNTAQLSKGKILKRSRMQSTQQRFSSWFLQNLQPDALKWGKYQMVLKNFGKRLRMKRGRTEGHGCTMSWLPSVANPTFSPTDPHPHGASIVFPGSQRQAVLSSLMASDIEHLKLHLTRDKGT